VPGSDADVTRLIAVIDRQRRELDRIRAEAAGESVIAMARGVLMERLGLSPADAAGQLGELSAATGVPVREMAAAVLSADEIAAAGPAAGATGSAATDARGRRGPPLGSPEAEAAAELAADGTELAGALAGQALAPLGAAAVVIWLLEADGSLFLLGEAGLSGAEASHWRRVPPQLDCPAQRVARGGPDLWWNAGRPAAYDAPVVGPPGAASAVLALRERNGDLLGVMTVAWPAPLAEFGSEARERLSAAAAGCARVLASRLAHGDLAAAPPRAAVYSLLDDLSESGLVLKAVSGADGDVTDFTIEHASPGYGHQAGRTGADLTGLTLLEAHPARASGPGLFSLAVQVLTEGASQRVPGPLSVPAPGGALARDLRMARFYDGVIVTWHEEPPASQAAALLEHAQRLGRLGGWEENLVTGTVRWTDSAFGLFGLAPRSGAEIPLADLHSYVMAADKPEVALLRRRLLERREAATATFRVVHPEDQSIRQIRVFAEPVTGPADPAGPVVALRGAFQDVSAHYHTQVALAATQDQLAEEHLLATRLQQAIMPPDAPPVEAAGIDVAVRYRPAGQGHLVGGDWYDTLLLPDNKVLLVVGDVAGHGIDAVTGMVAARNSLRGLVITGAGPADLLRLLNGVMCHLTSGVVGTVVCGLYDPDTRVLRWARAGHLPPVLVRAGAARQLPLPGGVLLGMDPDAGFEEATQPLQPGDAVLLFTDGLIERRGESIEEVLGEFVATVAEGNEAAGPHRGELTAAAQADRILASADSDTADDACLVVIRLRLAPARITLPRPRRRRRASRPRCGPMSSGTSPGRPPRPRTPPEAWGARAAAGSAAPAAPAGPAGSRCRSSRRPRRPRDRRPGAR
jgi:serine phosphatase RsbU (regulator of sigma subunit)